MGLFHSKRSPSSAHRWIRCPGSVRMEEGLPDTAGEEAIQGTCFHEVAADCLEYGVDPWAFVGTDIEWEETRDGERITIVRKFTPEMATKMYPGLIQLRAMADTPGAVMHVEKRVSLEEWVGEGESGTADCFIIDPLNRRIVNWDWKWGAGVVVLPEWNTQTILYTLGVWTDYAREAFNGVDPEDIEVMICIEQPRAPGGGGTWTVTMAELIEEGYRIRQKADETLKPEAPLVPGEKQCQFCKAARHNTCDARISDMLDSMGLDLDELEDDEVIEPLPVEKALSPKARSRLLLNKAQITSLLEQLHAEAMEDLRQGKDVPGMKRVPGRRPPRSWKDEGRAKVMLEHDFGSEAYTKKLISPATVEGELTKSGYKTRYESLVLTGEPAPTLVPEDDPREPMASVEDHWDLLDEPDELDENDLL